MRAEYLGEGFIEGKHPTIAVMGEYDALPNIGHACGHNLIGASGVGAFLAAVDAVAAAGIPGKVVFLGTPAEEGHSGKEYMIRGGMLDGIDAAVMMHPFSFDICSACLGRSTHPLSDIHRSAGSRLLSTIHGRTPSTRPAWHIKPWVRSEQMPPSDCLHAVISEGGERPSVIPSEAKMDVFVRSLMVETLVDLRTHRRYPRRAALMAGVTVERTWDTHPMSLPIRNNSVLADRWAITQATQGRQTLPADVVPDSLAASTDFGNVSHLVPAIHPMVKIAPEGVALHTEAFEVWEQLTKE